MLDAVPALMQRAKGAVRLSYDWHDQRNRLVDLHQAGCLKLMIPRNHAATPDAVLVNTAGGLTGGDHLSTEISVGAGASLRLAAQTAERIYQSTGDAARVDLRFTLGAAARFDWLAQETILFDHGRVQRRLEADIAKDASLLLVEPIVLGRAAMGETVSTGLIHDHWRIRRDGTLVFADAMRLDEFDTLRTPAALGNANAMATVLYASPDAEGQRDALKAICAHDGIHAGVSAWNGLVLMRFLSRNPMRLRAVLTQTIKTLRGDLPRVWTM